MFILVPDTRFEIHFTISIFLLFVSETIQVLVRLFRLLLYRIYTLLISRDPCVSRFVDGDQPHYTVWRLTGVWTREKKVLLYWKEHRYLIQDRLLYVGLCTTPSEIPSKNFFVDHIRETEKKEGMTTNFVSVELKLGIPVPSLDSRRFRYSTFNEAPRLDSKIGMWRLRLETILYLRVKIR